MEYEFLENNHHIVRSPRDVEKARVPESGGLVWGLPSFLLFLPEMLTFFLASSLTGLWILTDPLGIPAASSGVEAQVRWSLCGFSAHQRSGWRGPWTSSFSSHPGLCPEALGFLGRRQLTACPF